jgi:hypothetical protein
MADTSHLTIGSQARVQPATSDGSEIALVDFRSKRNVDLYFVREFI